MSEDRTQEFFSFIENYPDAERLRAGPKSISSSNASTLQQQHNSIASYTSGRYSNDNTIKPAQQNYSQELRNFHKNAATISKDIAITSTLLSELTKLVQNKSLFIDDSNKINNLVIKIKSNVENLNSRLDETNNIIQYQRRLLGKNSQQSQEAINVIEGLKDEFALATTGFKKVLQTRTDNIKYTTDEKLSVYGNRDGMNSDLSSNGGNDPSLVSLNNTPHVYSSSSNNDDTNTPSMMGANSNVSVASAGFPTLDLTSGYQPGVGGGMMAAGESTDSLPRPHGAIGRSGSSSGAYGRQDSEPIIPTYSGSTSSYYNNQTSGIGLTQRSNAGGHPNSGGYPMSPYDMIQHEQNTGQSQQMQLIPDQNYLRERAEAMSTVESNIVELGTIFNKLAVMVNEHSDLVQRIDDNVDNTASNIDLSMETLTKTLTDLRSNRGLALKIFGILVLFIVLFITFFA